MENDIYGEFRLKLGREVVMSNYWRLKFNLSRSMNERENYAELIRITVGTFKDDAESNLIHMRSLLRLSTPPFQRVPRNEDADMEESTQADASQGNGRGNNNAPDEIESSHRR